MSIFGNIMSAIFGGPAKADEVKNNPDAVPPTGATPNIAGTTAPAPASVPAASTTVADAGAAKAGAATPAAATAAKVASNIDVAAVLDKLTDESDENDIDWRKSIVDLMKLLKIDSGLKARKELAKELGYSGDMGDSATMNVWLHKQVMKKLSENGGKIPSELLKH